MEDFRREDTGDYLKRRLQKLLNSRIQKQISMNSLIRSFDRYLDGWIQKELIKDCISREAIQNLLLRKRQIHETVLAYMVRSEKDRFSTFQQESWFLPLISRDMLCQMDSEMGLYKNALIKLQALDAKNSFLYIFEEPCVHRPGDTWKCPEKMYLAAIQEGKEVRAFEEGGRPWISAEHPHSQETLHLTRREEHYASSVFCLFSGEIQYGVLVTEIPPEKISLFYLISRQIGNMLRLHQMSVEQQKLQKKLEVLHGELYRLRIPVVIGFEGWDAAGKGGAIRRLTSHLDPRGYKVNPTAAPNDVEKVHHYLWRFWREMPKAGHIAIFDRTWYGRVMVERIEGFCGEADWKRAYQEINEMEEHMANFGAVIVKFWIHIDKDEQERRFKERMEDPAKQWKITDEDWRNREKWDAYEQAVNEMLVRTSTTYAPWTIIEGNSKYFARVKVLETVVEAMEEKIREVKKLRK